MSALRVYIGADAREGDAYAVAEASLHKHASRPLCVTPLEVHRLFDNGLLRRPTDLRGQRYDILSNAPASTEFAISRFLVPLLAQTGWALFVDADVMFRADVAELFALADPSKALMVVKHAPIAGGGRKMDGQAQVAYVRKNWSSVVLWNCDHPANRRLSLVDVNERPGRDLHRFYWLHDDEIGELPGEWNHLVGIDEAHAKPKLAHFTLGVPTMPNCDASEFAVEWHTHRCLRS